MEVRIRFRNLLADKIGALKKKAVTMDTELAKREFTTYRDTKKIYGRTYEIRGLTRNRTRYGKIMKDMKMEGIGAGENSLARPCYIRRIPMFVKWFGYHVYCDV